MEEFKLNLDTVMTWYFKLQYFDIKNVFEFFYL